MAHSLKTPTWISAVMAAFSADSKPPSAIKLLTKRSIMKRRPGLTVISFPDAGVERKVPQYLHAKEFSLRGSHCHQSALARCPDRRSPALGRREDRALALSSAVGSSTDQPLCRTAWAAAWTVLSTPALLASTTTVCFRLLRSALPSPSPNSSGSTWLLMAAWS